MATLCSIEPTWHFMPPSAGAETGSSPIRTALDRLLDRIDEGHVRKAFQSLFDAMAAKSPATARHQSRVAELAGAIARQMNLSPQAIERVILSAPLHDIGKITIPAEILDNPCRLLSAEDRFNDAWRQKRQPQHSRHIGRIDLLGPGDLLDRGVAAGLQHLLPVRSKNSNGRKPSVQAG